MILKVGTLPWAKAEESKQGKIRIERDHITGNVQIFKAATEESKFWGDGLNLSG